MKSILKTTVAGGRNPPKKNKKGQIPSGRGLGCNPSRWNCCWFDSNLPLLMFRYIYNKLQTNSYRPYVLSKLNLWNILNSKHTTIRSINILYLVQTPNTHKVTNAGLLHGFFKKYSFNQIQLIVLTSHVVIAGTALLLL